MSSSILRPLNPAFRIVIAKLSSIASNYSALLSNDFFTNYYLLLLILLLKNSIYLFKAYLSDLLRDPGTIILFTSVKANK